MAIDEVENYNDTLINCVGVDNKIHVCKPYENKTMCGVDIMRKKLLKNDLIKLYSCYPCTY